MPEFFQTIMGRQFYEGTMPSLVKEIGRLNRNLETLITHIQKEAEKKEKEVEERPAP
jgi:hypothetical protein